MNEALRCVECPILPRIRHFYHRYRILITNCRVRCLLFAQASCPATSSCCPKFVLYCIPIRTRKVLHGLQALSLWGISFLSHRQLPNTDVRTRRRLAQAASGSTEFFISIFIFIFFFVFTFPCSAVVRGASIIFFPVLCRTGIQVSSRSQKLNEAGRCAGDPVFTTTAPHKLIFLLQLRKPGQPNCSAGRAGPTTLRCCGRPC